MFLEESMKCPECQSALPFRFALVIGSSRVSCPTCNATLAATKESLRKTAKATGGAGTIVGAIASAIAVTYSLNTHHWLIGGAAFLLVFIAVTFWSFSTGARVLEFEVVKT